MSNIQINDDRAVELATIGLSNQEIADQLGCSEASIRRALRRKGFTRHLIPVDLESRFHVGLDKPLVYNNVDAIVTADWHIPLYDPAYVNEMIETARTFGIRTLIIAGDFFNFDALSQYDPKQDDANLTREYYEGLAVMRVLSETFDRIVYVWGNHDARMHKALGFALQFKEAMKMVFGALGKDILSKIEFTNLDHMWLCFGEAGKLESGQQAYEAYDPAQRWYICHPQAYSKVALTTARAMSPKVNANVITAHAHHCAIGYAVDGKKVVSEAGGLFDATKTAYLQRSTTFPTWQQGFGYFVNGRFHLTSPGWETA